MESCNAGINVITLHFSRYTHSLRAIFFFFLNELLLKLHFGIELKDFLALLMTGVREST